MDSSWRFASRLFCVILVSTVWTVMVFVILGRLRRFTTFSEITSLSAHVSNMAKTNSEASVSTLRIRTRTIGRITSSSGAMKFSTPVAPSQMVGVSASSSSLFPAVLPLDVGMSISGFVGGSVILMLFSLVFCLGRSDGLLLLLSRFLPWKREICPFLPQIEHEISFLFGQSFALCVVSAQWKHMRALFAISTLSGSERMKRRLHRVVWWSPWQYEHLSFFSSFFGDSLRP